MKNPDVNSLNNENGNVVKNEKYIEFLVSTLRVSRQELSETLHLYNVSPNQLAEIIRMKQKSS